MREAHRFFTAAAGHAAQFSAVQRSTPDAARCEMSPSIESRGGAPSVTLLVRRNHTMTVDCTDTSELLAAVERKISVPREATWLCFAGKKLEAGMPLTHYGLSAGSTVHLAMRGRGGGWLGRGNAVKAASASAGVIVCSFFFSSLNARSRSLSASGCCALASKSSAVAARRRSMIAPLALGA